MIIELLMQTIKTIQIKTAQVIQGYLFKTGCQSFLRFISFTHLSQVIRSIRSKAPRSHLNEIEGQELQTTSPT